MTSRPSVLLHRNEHSSTLRIFIFVCCAFRLFHLELVSDYTVETFIAAYIRITSRLGLFRTLSSDEETNFVAADRRQQKMLSKAPAEFASVATYFASHGTQWRFKPPEAPDFGGLWKAAVKSTKFHLRRVIGDSTLMFKEMTTLLTQIEYCLHSWPLRAHLDDPTDISALKPGHFLIGSPLNAVSEPPLVDVFLNRLTLWQLIQQLRDHFWKPWSAEYLKELQTRSKWTTTSSSIQIGDLLLIRHENLPPTQWPMGRGLQLHPSKDGLLLVVTLRTKTSILDRSIVTLRPLPRSS
ncbi:uncharacterized protein LOC117177747 [Belonocnema kinseyi]|uniref:uncharacterized protein LOC117177747 n=1 Tax=Belonocnema kinseyi TaxID=2817044 RepID=UPI00143D2F9E|nr:uncharacterized protein LOC117177747 [Belonocnema kinseyi]